METFGDSHNLGKRVRLNGNVLVKPRSTYFEKLFLNKSSELRNFFRNSNTSLEELDTYYPDLKFTEVNSGICFAETKITKLEESIPSEISKFLCRSIGKNIALMQWFGISDLHCQNMMFFQKNNMTSVCPIDIEVIFSDIFYPSQSYLIGKKNGVAGFKKIEEINYDNPLENFIEIFKSYTETIESLNFLKPKIESLLQEILPKDAVVRAIFRDTQMYINKSNIEKYEESERVQLKRGDVPFYYKSIWEDKYYFISENEGIKSVPFQELNELKKNTKGLPQDFLKYFERKNIVDRLKTTLTIAEIYSYFKPSNTYGKHKCNNIEIDFDSNSISIKGIKIKCKVTKDYLSAS